MNKILFFAHLKDEVGKEFIHLDVSGKTVAELKEQLTKEYKLDRLDTAMTAINEEFANDDDKIAEYDTIAFIPPVSGG